MHQALATYYIPGRKRGVHPRKTFMKVYDEYLKENSPLYLKGDGKDERYEAGVLGPDMLDRYVKRWREDDDNIKIVLSELPFAVKMKDVGGQPFYYVGRMDAFGIWIPDDTYFILEHKTGSEDKKNALQLDEQAGSYYALVPLFLEFLKEHGKLKGKRVPDVDFIMYNFLRKAPKDTRPQNENGLYLNKNGSVSKVQPPMAFERIPVFRDEYDRKEIIKRIKREAFIRRMYREGKMPIVKNPTDRCSWDCQFYDMCELHETGSDWRGYAEQTMREEDSYEEYKHDLRKEVKL